MVKLRRIDETRCRRAAHAVLAECGISELPILPERVCEYRGIHYSHDTELPKGIWGVLMRQDGEFVILVSASCPTVGHRRFSAGHELGHYHLPGHLEALLTSGSHQSGSPYDMTDSLELEANAFSSELIMPEPLVTPIVDDTVLGLTTVRAIARRCEASLTAAAIRYSQLTPDPVAIVLSNKGQVEFSFVSSALWEYPGVAGGHPKRGDGIVPGTAAYRLATSPKNIMKRAEDSDAAELCAWFPACEPGGELVEESVGLGRYGRVLTILWTEELPDLDERY